MEKELEIEKKEWKMGKEFEKVTHIRNISDQ